VPTTAKDADDGGLTLAQAGKAAFNLMSPVEPFVSADGSRISSVVVSPMTTLVSHEMMRGVGKSAAASEAIVVDALGLTRGTNLRTNFAESGDLASLSMQKQARFIAAALGEVKKSILAGSANSTERERQIGALYYLRANARTLMAAANSSVAITANGQWRDARAALADRAVMPVPSASELVAQAQTFVNTSTTMDSAVADWDLAIRSGVFDAYCAFGGVSNLNPGATNYTYVCNAWNMVNVVSDGPGRFIAKPFVVANAAWLPFDSPDLSDSNFYPVLNRNGWTQRANASGTYTSDESGGFDVSVAGFGAVGNLRFTVKEIGGRTVASLIGVDSDSTTPLGSAGRYLPQAFRNTVFPSGSKAYVSRSTVS
jgi:hypothetical protein